jgi:adenylosuccinate synthase
MDADGDKLRKGGMEFGSTTGRPRRCGWLDLPALKYSIMLNGVDSLIMMKADVLDDFPEIKICTSYRTAEGTSDKFPFSLEEGIEPVYQTLKGWMAPISGAHSIGTLTGSFKQYLDFIQKETGLPIDMVSVGPERKQILT